MPYKRGNRWQGKVEVGGKVYYCGLHDRKRDALAAEVAKREELGDGVRGGRETCGSFGRRWLKDYPNGARNRPRRRSTRRVYADQISLFIRDFGDRPMVELDRPTIREWANRHPTRAKVVCTMFEDAYNDGLIPVNHWRKLGLSRASEDDVVILTMAEFEEACAQCRLVHGSEYGPQFEAMFRFASWTGVRPGELFAMKRSWLRPEQNILKVPRQRYRDGTEDTPKNHKAREVVLPDQAIAAIANLPAQMDGSMWVSKTGAPMTAGILTHDWALVRAAIGRPDLTWYQATKHFCGSQLALAGASDRAIAHQLGHTDDGETARRHYIHLRPSDTHDERMAAFARMGQAIPLVRRKGLAEAG